eukprot:2350546-Pleurochrysis_carterae.AAC.1
MAMREPCFCMRTLLAGPANEGLETEQNGRWSRDSPVPCCPCKVLPLCRKKLCCETALKQLTNCQRSPVRSARFNSQGIPLSKHWLRYAATCQTVCVNEAVLSIAVHLQDRLSYKPGLGRLSQRQEFMGQMEITQTQAAGMRSDASRSTSFASYLADASFAAASAARLCSNSLRSSEP